MAETKHEWRERMRSIGVLTRGRTRVKVTEGRMHPESGLPFKSVTDPANNTVTEHSVPGTGVSARQDVELRPKPVGL